MNERLILRKKEIEIDCMVRKSKEKEITTLGLSGIFRLVSDLLKSVEKAVKTDKEIKYIGELKLPFGMKTVNAMYQISLKPIKKKR